MCGPCWAAHGGKPAAAEIAAAPVYTAPLRYPKGQRGYLAALKRAEWVQEIRVDGREHLLAIARVLALTADWDTLETWPGWDVLCRRTGLSESTVQRWLQELKLRGWIVVIETGSTPLTRPMALRHLVLPDGTEVWPEGNRRAVYALRIPLSSDEAIAWAAQTIAAEAERDAARAAEAAAARRRERMIVKVRHLLLKSLSSSFEGERAVFAERAQALIAAYGLTEAELADPELAAAKQRRADAQAVAEQLRALSLFEGPEMQALYQAYLNRLADPETVADQADPVSVGEEKGWPTRNFSEGEVTKERGYAREAVAVDDCGTPVADPWGGNDQMSALRARSDQNEGLSWASRVPVTEFEMLIAASWLQERLPVFARLTRFAVRKLCRPLYAVGWSNLDVVHAMDHLPGVFGSRSEKPIGRGPDSALWHARPGQARSWRYYATAATWISTRLDAWRDADGRILRGYYQDRGRQVAMRQAVAERYGRAGVRLLQQGGLTAEAELTPQAVVEFGRRVSSRRRRDEKLAAPPRRPRPAAASEQARDQARQRFETSEQERRERAVAARHEEILRSHGPALDAARAELAAATGTSVAQFADPQLLAEQDALTPQERHERARAAAAGFRRSGTTGFRARRERRRWSR